MMMVCIILGCTNIQACNYDTVLATEDFEDRFMYCIQMRYIKTVMENCLNDSDGDGVCDELESTRLY